MAKENATPVEALPYKADDKPAKSYVPEGFESQEDFLKNLREEYEYDLSYDDTNRKEALEDKKFVAGDQWDAEVLAARKDLPNLVINNIPQFTAQVVGDWRDSRPAIKVLPSEEGDQDTASVRADLIRAIESQSRASRVYDNGFESAVQCGDGAWRVAVEYARDDVFDQELFIRPIDDALSVVWDRLSIDPTGRDARHVFVDDLLPESEFKDKWPDHDPSTLGDSFSKTLLASGWTTEDSVRVTEYWRMIERKRLLALFEDGSVHFIDKDNADELIMTHGQMTKSRMAPCLYAQMHLVTGFAILAGPYEYKLNRVPIIRCSGRVVNVGGDRVRFGIVRFMRDPARLKNFWRSTAAEQLGYLPKAKWMATESAVEGRENAIRTAHLNRDPLLIFNDEAIFGQNVLRVDPPPLEAALLNEAAVNAQDMKDVTGIHDASLGIKSNETSGRAINARQREGDIANLTYSDNGNAAILETGDVLNQLISQIYDGTRIARVIGEDQTVKFVKLNDPADPKSPNLASGKFDVVMTTGASYMTRRIEAAEAMMQAVQVWPEIMQIAGDLVVKAQDWPGAEDLAERLKKTIPEQFLDDDEKEKSQAPSLTPQQVQEVMAEMQALQAKVQQLETDREIEFRKLAVDVYNAETQRIRALSDHEVDATQQNMDGIKAILDFQNKERDREFSSTTSSASSSSGNSP